MVAQPWNSNKVHLSLTTGVILPLVPVPKQAQHQTYLGRDYHCHVLYRLQLNQVWLWDLILLVIQLLLGRVQTTGSRVRAATLTLWQQNKGRRSFPVLLEKRTPVTKKLIKFTMFCNVSTGLIGCKIKQEINSFSLRVESRHALKQYFFFGGGGLQWFSTFSMTYLPSMSCATRKPHPSAPAPAPQ